MIQLRNLEKRHQTRAGFTCALRQINLDVSQGDFLTFMGPSGTGKSTLRTARRATQGGWMEP